jgi:hypothetical protein
MGSKCPKRGGYKRNLYQLLKGNQPYTALYGVYAEALQNVMAVLRGSAAKGETAKTTIAIPLSTEEFHEQRR